LSADYGIYQWNAFANVMQGPTTFGAEVTLGQFVGPVTTAIIGLDGSIEEGEPPVANLALILADIESRLVNGGL
jgi:hypothetical protein